MLLVSSKNYCRNCVVPIFLSKKERLNCFNFPDSILAPVLRLTRIFRHICALISWRCCRMYNEGKIAKTAKSCSMQFMKGGFPYVTDSYPIATVQKESGNHQTLFQFRKLPGVTKRFLKLTKAQYAKNEIIENCSKIDSFVHLFYLQAAFLPIRGPRVAHNIKRRELKTLCEAGKIN